jgi:hypothetical protein
MTTLKARATLEARDREFRIKELKRLLARHKGDPDYRQACTGWARELVDLRDWETSTSTIPVPEEIPWEHSVTHALDYLRRERQKDNHGTRTAPKTVAEVRRAYYDRLRATSPFLRG